MTISNQTMRSDAAAPRSKVIIRDSDGDDTLIISGDQDGQLIDADLGPGNDRIVHMEKGDGLPANASTGLSGSGIVALAIVALLLCGLILLAYRRRAR